MQKEASQKPQAKGREVPPLTTTICALGLVICDGAQAMADVEHNDVLFMDVSLLLPKLNAHGSFGAWIACRHPTTCATQMCWSYPTAKSQSI